MLKRSVVAAALVAACGGGSSSGGGGTPSTPVDDAGTSLLTLAPGEVVDIDLTDSRAAARLATPNGTERFVAIVASTELGGSKPTYAYSVSSEPVELPTASRPASGCVLGSEPWSKIKVPEEKAPSGTGPAVGATRSIHVSVGDASETITARAAAVGASAVVWVDTTPAHPATVEPAFIDAFLADFEKTILPRERSIFGVESDLDGDGRIGLVFTPLTKDTAVAFFSGCDLLESGSSECLQGNKGEYLYLTPQANIAAPYNTPEAMKEILAHELGHLVHFNRKVVKNKLTSWDDGAYMIEGFGAFAQDVVGFQAGNFYVAQAGLDRIAEFSLADTLGAPGAYDKARDGALRGGSYLFVRYLYDRAGGDAAGSGAVIEGRGGPALLRALLDSPEPVSKKISQVTSGAPGDLMMDFYTALALSNGEKGGNAPPANPCFAYMPTAKDPVTGKQRGADVFASFHGQAMKGPAMQSAAKADGKLRAGGVEYLKLDAAEGLAELDVAITVDSAAAPRIRIARVK